MEGTFTVEEAARIMGCDRATIYRLVADGWLVGLAGKPNNAGSAQVSKKSLYQFMIVDRLSLYPERVLRKMLRRKISENNSSQSPTANRYINEGEDNAPEALPSGTPSQENRDPEKRCPHYDFAAQHQAIFRKRARQLAANDPAFQDDLVQEMSLAVLEYDNPADFEFLLELAFNRAIDYIRYEASRGMLTLNKARQTSDKRAEQIASLQTFIDELRQRGVPAEWIEEVIGWRLNVA